MVSKWTEENARQFEKNLPNALDFIEKSRKSKRLDIMKLRDIMNCRL